jgi:hypothetical protein
MCRRPSTLRGSSSTPSTPGRACSRRIAVDIAVDIAVAVDIDLRHRPTSLTDVDDVVTTGR